MKFCSSPLLLSFLVPPPTPTPTLNRQQHCTHLNINQLHQLTWFPQDKLSWYNGLWIELRPQVILTFRKFTFKGPQNLYLRRIEHVMDCCWVSCSFRTKYILPVIIRDMYCPPIDCLLVHIFSCQLRKRALCVWQNPISERYQFQGFFPNLFETAFETFWYKFVKTKSKTFLQQNPKKNCNQMFSCTIKELTSFGGWRTRAEEWRRGEGGYHSFTIFSCQCIYRPTILCQNCTNLWVVWAPRLWWAPCVWWVPGSGGLCGSGKCRICTVYLVYFFTPALLVAYVTNT